MKNKQQSQPKTPATGFGKLGTWIAGLTGVLIIVPSLINAGGDIIASINDLPKSESEEVNAALFQKHFGKQPVFHGKTPIKTAKGLVEMELEVHSGGDIFVRYGPSSQWFHSPFAKKASLFSIVGAAFAQSPVFNPAKTYTQQDVTLNGKIVRNRYFKDGKLETFTINPNTGVWSKPQIQKYNVLPDKLKFNSPVTMFPQIDLTK